MARVRSVAVIGAGPAGAITVDALSQEQAFDVIRVFERREQAGGCWLQDPPSHVQELPDLSKLANRTADTPLTPPANLPTRAPKSKQYRFSDTSIYPALETNIDVKAMSYTQEPIPDIRSEWSIQKHGADTPFRHWTVIKDYILSLLNRNNYQSLVSYNTTVELVRRTANKKSWRLTLRKSSPYDSQDYWWTEEFDAVVVASGHYHVPYIPAIAGLPEFASRHPGSVIHSKSFRDPEFYRGKRVVTIGASVSGPDIASTLAGLVKSPLYAVVRGKYHPYFFDYAFQHPMIERKPPIACFESWGGARTVVFEDGTRIEDVDYVVFGTGYSWTLPFLEKSGVGIKVKNNRVPGLYQHIFWRNDPTLCFIGGVAAGFTFKVFEWQAVLAARYLAGRIALPPLAEQVQWEVNRIAYKGDGVSFTAIYPDFEEYFEDMRHLAGEPIQIPSTQETGLSSDVQMIDADSQEQSNQSTYIAPTLLLKDASPDPSQQQDIAITPQALMLHEDYQEYLDALMPTSYDHQPPHHQHTTFPYGTTPSPSPSPNPAPYGPGGGTGNPFHAAMLHEDFQEYLDTMLAVDNNNNQTKSPLDPSYSSSSFSHHPDPNPNRNTPFSNNSSGNPNPNPSTETSANRIVNFKAEETREVGRRLPRFEKRWRADFDAAHLRRIEMWKTMNREAKEELEGAERRSVAAAAAAAGDARL